MIEFKDGIKYYNSQFIYFKFIIMNVIETKLIMFYDFTIFILSC